MNYLANTTFLYPMMLWLLLLVPVLIVFYVLKNNWSFAAITLPSPWRPGHTPRRTYKNSMRHVLFGIRMLALALLIVILARPQSSSSWKNITSEGIDIVIAQDISGSMMSEDLSPNRIEAAKKKAGEFIDARPQDKIGLVIFSGMAFTQCPLTTDHAVVKNLLQEVHTGMIEDGTAIGDGLATAVNRLKDDKVKSKIVILLTDGVNNTGSIAPMTAAEIAKLFGIRVYTIGIGTMGKARTPVARLPNGQFQYAYEDVEIDEALLKKIADMTGGKYFRSTDNDKLQKVYREIDTLEKSRIQEKDYTEREEKFIPFAIAACFLLLIELIIKNTVLKTIP
jgi:Ca-activated chloride channel family protein